MHVISRIKGQEELVREVTEKYNNPAETFIEQSRRVWAGNESLSIGYAGIGIVSIATDLSRSTIIEGMKEITDKKELKDRIRDHGWERKKGGVKESRDWGGIDQTDRIIHRTS